MTGLGIAVAIPAVVFYNLAIRINRKVMYHANDRAHDLLAQSTRDALPKTESTPRAVTSERVDATTSNKQTQPQYQH